MSAEGFKGSKSGYDEFQIALLPGIGSSRGRLLLERFGEFKALHTISEQSLLEVRGISHHTAAVLRNFAVCTTSTA